MKKLVLSALTFLSLLSPMFAFAAVDCSADQSATKCTCFQSSGTVQGNQSNETGCITYCTLDTIKAASYQFDFCENGNPVSSGNISLSYDASQQTETTTPDYTAVIPVLNVPIPGLDLSNRVVKTEDGTIESSILSAYLSASFKFLLGAGSTLAIVMLMVGGLEYATSGGSHKRLERAQHRIRGAVVGLILLFAAFDLTYLLDPRLTELRSIRLQYIKGVPILEREEDPERLATDPTDLSVSDPSVTTVSGNSAYHIIAQTSEDKIGVETLERLKIAATAFYEQTGKNVWVTSASRPVSLQAQLFFERFIGPGATKKPSTCDPTGSPMGRSSVVSYSKGSGFSAKGALLGVTDESQGVSILTENGDPRNCPHTSNVAVDIFPEGSPGGYTADVKLMSELNNIMVANGFCRLRSEAWHYELEGKQLSKSSCTSFNTDAIVSGHNPAGCKLYNFKDFCCVTDDDTVSGDYPTMCQ